MEQIKPATPAQAATPGNASQVPGTTSPVTPATVTPGQGVQAEGSVIIPTKEYAQLQRDHARVVGFNKRAEFSARKNPPINSNGEGNGDPEVAAILQREQDARIDSEKRAFKAEVTLKVRDLLDKEEFKSLPASTRALILKNPSMLSDADNVDEALLDIEDFVRDQVVLIPVQNFQQIDNGNGSRANNPVGHETPPVVGSGPVPVQGIELEDISKLSGPARSRAVLRNALKNKKRGIQ